MRTVNRKHSKILIYVVGIGLRKGYGLSGYDHCKASMAADALAIRAMQVAASPDTYCRYTNELVKSLDKYWPDAKFQTGMSVTKRCITRCDGSGRFSDKKMFLQYVVARVI